MFNGTFVSIWASFFLQLIWVYDALDTRIYNETAVVFWPRGNFPPLSDAPCMKDLQLCSDVIEPLSIRTYVVSSLSAVVAAIIIFLGIWYYVIKKLRLSNNSWWLIPDTEITDSRISGDFSIAGVPLQFDVSKLSWYYENAVYRGRPVRNAHVKTDKKVKDILKQKDTLKSLLISRQVDHPNVANFYGVCFPTFIASSERYLVAVSEFPAKGLLRTYIDQDDLSFGWDLRFSLIWDLINGLRYIFGSALQYHGCLNFSGLIVDCHFTLKISGAGLSQCYSSLQPESFTVDAIPRFCCLWMAPEVLNKKEKALTSAADIYSLAVVLYEMSTRNTPFNVSPIDPAEIEEKLLEIHQGRMQPTSYIMPKSHPNVEKLIYQAWSFDPADRPKINDFARALKSIHPHHNSFTDNLIRRLQTYNRDLETIVEVRTKALRGEKDKVDELLTNLLPASIVRELRSKQIVLPEFFEAVSILFSDIPVFKTIVATCAPLIIVNLLHLVYSVLDAIVPQFDVYKVETISDSYMVASGLPVRNGEKHAPEIAGMALAMLGATSALRDFPECGSLVLRLRIGINSGPCVGVVIGTKLPHYTLVGDTVNTASRIETSGEESKIHMSETTRCLLDGTGNFITERRGVVMVKGKGEMTTYWLISTK